MIDGLQLWFPLLWIIQFQQAISLLVILVYLHGYFFFQLSNKLQTISKYELMIPINY